MANKNLSHVSEFISSGSSPGSRHGRSPMVFISLTPRLLDIPTAAVYIASTSWHIEEMCRSGELPYLVIGKRRVIDVQDLEAWIRGQKKHTGHLPPPRIFAKPIAA